MDEIETAKELIIGLLERMGMKAEVEGTFKEGNLYIEIKGDREGILIGKHGRTLESLQLIFNRIVNKKLKNSIKLILDVDGYKKRRADTLVQTASRLGEKVKMTKRPIMIGPFNAQDRRIIHLALKEDPSIKTESLGEGEFKKIKIIPIKQET